MQGVYLQSLKFRAFAVHGLLISMFLLVHVVSVYTLFSLHFG